MKSILKIYSFLILFNVNAQFTPQFGNEIHVNILGLPHDAMEPFISPDGNALFFNNLNDAVSTSIYYAAKIDDSTFTYLGLFPVVNQAASPRLDAVASLDIHQNFYWVSNRGYPDTIENLYHVTFGQSSYSNFGRVYGDFYITSPGYIIMDAGIDYYGYNLYYCNAYFNNCGALPCFSKISVASKINDSTFVKQQNSDFILNSINDTLNYINYAPCITKDGLELYYTRAPINGSSTELLVTTRPDTLSPFGVPVVLDNSPFIPEGATLTTDKNILYYHKKVGGIFKIVMRYRTPFVGISENEVNNVILFPNPASDRLHVSFPKNSINVPEIEIQSSDGNSLKPIFFSLNTTELTFDIKALQSGIYYLRIGNSYYHFIKI